MSSHVCRGIRQPSVDEGTYHDGRSLSPVILIRPTRVVLRARLKEGGQEFLVRYTVMVRVLNPFATEIGIKRVYKEYVTLLWLVGSGKGDFPRLHMNHRQFSLGVL